MARKISLKQKKTQMKIIMESSLNIIFKIEAQKALYTLQIPNLHRRDIQ